MNFSSLTIAKIGAWVLFTGLVITSNANAFFAPGTWQPQGVCDDAKAAGPYPTSSSSCNACVSDFNGDTSSNISCNTPITFTINTAAYTCGGTFNGGGACTGNLTPEIMSCPDVGGVPASSMDTSTGLCEYPGPNPDQCTTGGTHWEVVGSQATPFICISGCQYQFSGLGGLTISPTFNTLNQTSSTAHYSSTGEECTGSEQTNTPGQNPNVTDNDNDGIPEVDNQELPPSPPPDNGCVLLPNGGLYCGGGVSTPPAPDNGTPGMGATPDQTVTNNTNNTTNNYYGPGTTSGNSSGSPDGTDSGVCDPATEVCGTDEETGIDNGCNQLPTCTGDAIDCLLAKLAHDTRCNLQSDTEDVVETDVMAQIGTTETVEEVFAVDPMDEIDVDTEFFDVTAGAGSCPAPLSITIPYVGATSIPFTTVCDVLSLMRPAVLLFSNIIAGLMLFRAFRDGL